MFLDKSDPDAVTDMKNMHLDTNHMTHCFDFLRQTIMCAADSNLEKVDVVGKNGLKGSTGWGFERQCRNYDSLVKWVEENGPS
jgi:hypothetical protein